MNSNGVSIEEFELIFEIVLLFHSKKEEPIPVYNKKSLENIESCLKSPFQTFLMYDLYPTFKEKAAILFYLLIKNHPLQNGNKRLAVSVLVYFYSKNNIDFTLTEKELYDLAIHTAKSRNKEKAY